MNQSRPCWLARDGVGRGLGAGNCGTNGTSIAADGRSLAAIVVNPIERRGKTSDQIYPPSMVKFPRLQAAGRAEHDDRRVLLVFGRRHTCSLFSSSVMLSLLLATPPKRSAFQSTTIFRLPTPRKPPKSMTAARTVPSRSTITSTMRPMSSLAALRTSRPRMPCASRAPITVTDGGGAGSFAAPAAAVLLPCVARCRPPPWRRRAPPRPP